MPPAARVGDMHVCPMVDPGPKPHVGGPVLPAGCPMVLVGGQPAARVGDMATCVHDDRDDLTGVGLERHGEWPWVCPAAGRLVRQRRRVRDRVRGRGGRRA